MNPFRILLAMPLLLAAAAAYAQEREGQDQQADQQELDRQQEQAQKPLRENFEYLFVQLGWAHDAPQDGPDADGFSVGGSMDISKNLFLAADYGRSQSEEFQDSGHSGTVVDGGVSLGVGGHIELFEPTDATLFANYFNRTTRGHAGFAPAAPTRHEGVGLGLGVRHRLSKRFEVSGGPSVTYDHGDITGSLGAGLQWRIAKALAAGIGLSGSEDGFSYGISLRSYLPSTPSE